MGYLAGLELKFEKWFDKKSLKKPHLLSIFPLKIQSLIVVMRHCLKSQTKDTTRV